MLQSPSFMQTLKKAGFLPLRITITRQIPFQVRAGGRGKAWGLPPKPGSVSSDVCAHLTPTAPALKVVHT